jgi:hypothetical protein
MGSRARPPAFRNGQRHDALNVVFVPVAEAHHRRTPRGEAAQVPHALIDPCPKKVVNCAYSFAEMRGKADVGRSLVWVDPSRIRIAPTLP